MELESSLTCVGFSAHATVL